MPVQPGAWTISPLQTTLFTNGIVNAASLTPDIAPGGLVSVFGAGLAGASVTVNGESAVILAAFPFQINAEIPPDIPTGTATVAVTASAGSVAAQIAISSVAPEVFVLSPAQAAITNQDNMLNTASNPASRGAIIVICGTGFGVIGSSGGLNPVKTPLTVVIGGTTHSCLRGPHARSHRIVSGQCGAARGDSSWPCSAPLFEAGKRNHRNGYGECSMISTGLEGSPFKASDSPFEPILRPFRVGT